MLKRPPVVSVLGHVDHGKTSLISKIKEVDLTKKEFGGISQHTGAYQIVYKNQPITFIDTPGHEAFSKMRSRGAQVADLVILVVAATEGVKPQTRESLKHILDAKIPYIVALNKIDLPEANLDWAKANLAENGILIEGWGGDVVVVPLSAKTGKGVDQLLEMIILVAEMQNLEADANAPLEAIVIESRVDPHQGSIATLLVKNGTLHFGDEIRSPEGIYGKVKSLTNDIRQKVTAVGPGQPAEVLGFAQTPAVGSVITSFHKGEAVLATAPLALIPASDASLKQVKIILKTDVAGTKEAILGSLPSEVSVMFSGIGDINDSDILLAKTTGADVLGFNVKISGAVKKLAETEEIIIRSYKIIYDLLQYLEKRVLKLIEPMIDETVLGKAEILAQFEINKNKIVGCKVIEGEITKTDRFHLMRDGQILADCRLKSLKSGKLDVEKVKKGDEFGGVLSPNLDFVKGDMLVSFKKVEE